MFIRQSHIHLQMFRAVGIVLNFCGGSFLANGFSVELFADIMSTRSKLSVNYTIITKVSTGLKLNRQISYSSKS